MFDKVGMEKIKNSLEGKNGCIIQITKKAKRLTPRPSMI